MRDLVPYRKFAVGYTTKVVFADLIRPYLATISEVFFSWPGMVSGRTLNYSGNIESEKKRLLEDLSWCKQHNIKLDLLFNGNCYGDDCFSEKLRAQVYDVIDQLSQNGLMPEVITTTSQFIAKCIKVKYPEIDIRASVNMRLESTKAMEFVSDLFDSFYICRDLQRDLTILELFSKWCKKKNKKLCMLANSACLRCCPVQTFHDNFLCHGAEKIHEQVYLLRFPFRLCERHFQDQKNSVDYLRMSWIRPEDLHCYEPFVSTIKLATRDIDHPDLVLNAYCHGAYDGNVLDYLGIEDHFVYLDNKSFPEDWMNDKIAQSCAINCNECGKCSSILNIVQKQGRETGPSYSFSDAFLKTQTDLKI